jgi:hypothetical protein
MDDIDKTSTVLFLLGSNWQMDFEDHPTCTALALTLAAINNRLPKSSHRLSRFTVSKAIQSRTGATAMLKL